MKYVISMTGVLLACLLTNFLLAQELAPQSKPALNGLSVCPVWSAEGNFRPVSRYPRNCEFPGVLSQSAASGGDSLNGWQPAGALTSQAAMKRWNRKNEQLGLATEAVAVMADWLGAPDDPWRRINDSWGLVLKNQQPEIISGNSSPAVYEYAWNDEILALNQFASELTNAASAVISAMDTRGKGQTLVVYNPLSIPRTDLVEAFLSWPDETPEWVKVYDSDNKEIPVQISHPDKKRIKVMFLASLPSLGMACYDVVPSEEPGRYTTSLSADKKSMANEWLKVTINSDGDIASIIDKKNGRELLAYPSRLLFQKEHPRGQPALNMDWVDREKPPFDSVHGPATITLVETGLVRAVVKIERKAQNSTFSQYVLLISGKDQVMVHSYIQWQSRGVSLKASFPLTVSNRLATCNLGTKTIERSTNSKESYEFPFREWFDLTDKSGNYGVTIFENCKYGVDKPKDNTLRLTLLYTPTTNSNYDQATQDWGIHEIVYGFYPHKGDWRTALSYWQARGLNQPFRVFLTPQHPGFLGKRYSFAQVSVPQVDLASMKKAENGNGYIIRLQEISGSDISNVEIGVAGKVNAAWEVDAMEQKTGDAILKNGKLITNLEKSAIRSYWIQPEPPVKKLMLPVSTLFPIPFDQDIINHGKNKNDSSSGPSGFRIPAALFPDSLFINGISFKLGDTTYPKNNLLSCDGQKIQLPAAIPFNRIYLLAAATDDTTGVFKVGNKRNPLHIQSFTGKIGQSDHRIWDQHGRIKGVEKGFIKRNEVAWYATHLYHDTLNIPCQYGYLFLHVLEASPTDGFIQLPENKAIKIFAITLSNSFFDPVQPALPLYDNFSERTSLALNLPKSHVTESMTSAATVHFTHTHNLSDLPVRPTMRDYADIHQPNGVTVKYYFSGTNPTFTSIKNGADLPAIIDGMYDLLPGESLRDDWSEQGEGRLLMYLQKETELDSIHVFTLQDIHRGGQSFSLWGSTGPHCPSSEGDPAAAGWNFLLLVKPADILDNARGVYSIRNFDKQFKRLRYLLWISEDSFHGPYYFREIDVFEKQK